MEFVEEKNKIDGLGRANEIKKQLALLISGTKIKPNIAIIQVGNNPSSNIYIRQKIKTAQQIGITAKHIHLEERITEEELLDVIKNVNNDKSVDGMIVQLPLPEHINKFNVLSTILPNKDLDGLHPFNAGLLHYSQTVPYCVDDVLMKKFSQQKLQNLGKTIGIIPCTPLGCLDLLQHECKTLAGKNAVVIGNSNLVGRPISRLLTQSGATTATIHSKSRDVEYLFSNADIIVSATGVGQDLKNVKQNAIIIDVAIRYNEEQKLCGDLNYNELVKTNRITPVPKGVGPMTVACLMVNSYLCCLHNHLDLLD